MTKTALAPVLLNGPEANRAADRIMRQEAEHSAWPYRWKYPPPNASRRMPQGIVAVPTIGNTAQILAFAVPTNFNFYLWQVIVTAGAGFSVVPGDIQYTIDVDNPNTGPVPLSGSPLADFNLMNFGLGSIVPWAPCELSKAELFTSGQTLRAKGHNVQATSTGAPNYLVAMFLGWLVPAVK